METKKVELGDGEPSPPLAEAKELFELYLGVSKSSDVNTYVDWYKRVNDWLKRNSGAAQEVSPPSPEPDIEAISARVHDSWIAQKRAQGFHGPEDICPKTNLLPRERFGCCKKYHVDMVPYSELTEAVKELDRATVRTVLKAMGESGDTRELKAALRQFKVHLAHMIQNYRCLAEKVPPHERHGDEECRWATAFLKEYESSLLG